jgi:hypothetical protein
MPFSFVERVLVGAVATPYEMRSRSPRSGISRGAIARESRVSPNYFISPNPLSFPKSTAILIGNPSNVDIPAARGSDKLERES